MLWYFLKAVGILSKAHRFMTRENPMTRPVVGIIGNQHMINDTYEVHAGGAMNSDAVANVSNCLPLLIPSDPRLVGGR